MEKPLQRDVLVGSVGQRSSDGDGECSAFELLKGDVNGVRKGIRGLDEDGGAHGDLESPRPYYSSFFKSGEFRRANPDFLFLARFLKLPHFTRLQYGGGPPP